MSNQDGTLPISAPSAQAKDVLSGLVVFLVAVPLCLGMALASDAPLFSGLLAGIIGGVLVGAISGSQCSVSGPAAGLNAAVAAQIASLGSFEAFLLAFCFAGLLQIVLGMVKSRCAELPSNTLPRTGAIISALSRRVSRTIECWPMAAVHQIRFTNPAGCPHEIHT